MKPFLNIFGSSHAKRLARAFRKNKHFTNKYNLIENVKPGAVFTDLTFPKFETLKENDVLVIQLFGNELFEKRIKITNRNGKRTIHLLKYCPIDQSIIQESYKQLKDKLKDIQAKVYVLDNIIRHTHCCSEHTDRRIGKFQLKQNQILRQYFSNLPNITVLDHRKYIGIGRKKYKNLAKYSQYSTDSVHMIDSVYYAITDRMRIQLGL